MASSRSHERDAQTVLYVDKLRKTFVKPFVRTKVEAVRGISFEVRRGDIFGFLGPNGAGKTTTIKMLTGLIFPTSGTAKILGDDVPSPEAMGKVGFLPENPYVYPYLTPREFVSLCGRLNASRARTSRPAWRRSSSASGSRTPRIDGSARSPRACCSARGWRRRSCTRRSC